MVTLRKLLDPAAYVGQARARIGAWTEMGQVARNWPAWIWRDLWRPLRGIRVTVRTRDGARFLLDDDPIDDRILRHIYLSAGGLYFPPGAVVAPGDLILDVGAHSGIYAVAALRRYAGASLTAVEPNPATCERLRRNLRANGLESRARVVQAALGPWSGETLLELRKASWGDRTHPRNRPVAGPGAIVVPMVTVPDILGQMTPALVKCNAEGAEFDIFPQMFEAGIRPGFVILMTHPDVGPAGQLVRLFRETGYVVNDADRPPRGSRFHCRLERSGLSE